MKKIAVFGIGMYKFVSPVFVPLLGESHCRYEETCSRYTKRMIRQKGFLKGIVLGARRLAACRA